MRYLHTSADNGSSLSSASAPSQSVSAFRGSRENGRWWMYFTISRPDSASERKRISLKTADLEKVRGRRDGIIADLQNKAHVFV